MLRHTFIIFMTFFLSFSAFAYEDIIEGSYYLYDGDYNNDGTDDLILYPHNFSFISGPIGVYSHTDTGVHPIALEKNSLISTSSYNLIYPADIAVFKTLFDDGLLVNSEYKLLFGDLGNTGYLDIVLQPVSDESDLIVLSNQAAGLKAYTFDLADFSYNLIGSNSVTMTISNGKLVSMSDLYGETQISFDFSGSDSPTVSFAYPQSAPSQTGSIVGEIPNSAWVDVSGAARYAVPIRLPSGIKNLQPNLLLSYNSNRSNGALGVGWSLSGVPSIRRCNANMAEDGFISGINLDKANTGDNQADRYCLNGQKLVSISSSGYGTVGATYKTELESFQKIVSIGGEVGNPQYWEVTDSQGNTWTYGNNVDAILKSGAMNLTWSISQIKDTSGNQVNYTYENISADGVVRVSNINYAATTVNFTYSTRADVQTRYFAGKTISDDGRLDKIKISNSNFNYEYKLTYGESFGTKRSILNSLDLCGGDGSKCVTPTTFTYQDQDTDKFAHLNVNSGYLGNYFWFDGSEGYASSFFPLDFNGDGYQDLAKVLRTGTSKGISIYLNNEYSIFKEVTGISVPATGPEHHFLNSDINGDGYDDIIDIEYIDGQDKFYPFISNGKDALTKGDGVLFGSEEDGEGNGLRYKTLDINSDGINDLINLVKKDDKAYAMACIINSDGTIGDCTETELGEWTSIGDLENSHFILSDINGDGLQDLVSIYQESLIAYLHTYKNEGNGSFSTQIEKLPVGAWVTVPGRRPDFKLFDINGDGLSDIVKIHDGGNTSVDTWLNDGANGFVQATQNHVILSEWAAGRSSYHAIDVNLDGIKDLMHVFNDGTYSVSLSWISDFKGGFHTRTTRQLNESSGINQFMVMDSNGSGSGNLLEIFSLDSGGKTHAIPVTWKPSATSYQDKLIEVNNGLTVSNKYEYGVTSDPEVYQVSNGERPKGEVRISNVLRTLVKSVQTDNGIGGFNQEHYRYYDLKTHYQGIGSLGFGRIEKFDIGQNLAEVSQFNQDWSTRRYASLKMKEVCSLADLFEISTYSDQSYCQSNPSNMLERESHVWTSDLLGSNGTDSYHVYKEQSLYEKWGASGDFISNRLVKRAYDTNGNLTNQTTEYGTGSRVNADSSFTLSGIAAIEQIEYNYDHSNLTNKHIFKPSSITNKVTEVVGETNKGNITNTTNFQYNSIGLLTVKTTEPGKDNQITETYSNFDRGLAQRITRTWSSANTANSSLPKSSASEQYQYDVNGSVTSKLFGEGLSYSQAFTAHPLFDVQSSYKDINGQITTTEVDILGRVTKVVAPQYTTNYEFKDCNGCGNNARYYVYKTTTAQPDEKAYYDTLGRNVVSNKQILNGAWSQVTTEYNTKGQVTKVSEPSIGTPSHFTTYVYDNAGRTIKENRPASDHWIDFKYEGLEHTKIENFNGSSQKSKNFMNAFGLLSSGEDALENKTQYFYNGRKQLVKTIDVDLNEITIEYDVYGNRTKLVDPDKGTWTFTNNAFGLVASENNGNGQVTSFNYDLLGRMTSRTNSEGTSTWQYDVAPNGMGQLYQAKQNGYKETYAYDGFGNLAQKAVEFGDGQTAKMNWHYVQGKLNTQTFPGGYAIRQVYNSTGYLSEIQNYDNAEDKHWQAISMDARGNLTGYKLDGTLTTTRSYDAATGFVQSIKSGWNKDDDAQLSSYTFDSLGNLKTRDNKLFMDSVTRQANQRTGQSFNYDVLNRLAKWNTRQFGDNQDAIQTLEMEYEKNGNIDIKPDVGDYTYGEYVGANSCASIPGPHAVSYIAGKGNYCYDQSGNMLSGDGKTLTYTSFDKPKTINKSGSTTEILYGPSLGRYKRIDTVAGETQTTWYLDGLYEKVLDKNSKTTERFYLGDFGLMERTTASNGTVMDQTRYFLKDHIGSVLAIAEGNSMRLLQEFHYDVWGKREYTKVNDDPSLPAWDSFGLTGRQGFTGHEMLDNVGLIHMNGRVYDPELARFVSADPKIPDPYNSQAFNRYTYVYNNPLSFIDPDGFEPDSIHLGGFLDRDFYLSRDGRINWRERGVNNRQAQRDLEMSSGNNNPSAARARLDDMHVSDRQIELTKKNEGFKPRLYDDDGAPGKGNTTIGYGHLVHKGEIDDRASERPFYNGISKLEGHELLKKDLSIAEADIKSLVDVDLTQNQFDALVDLAFHIGRTRLARTKLIGHINREEFDKAANEFNFREANGKRVRGLELRSNSRYNTFKNRDYSYESRTRRN